MPMLGLCRTRTSATEGYTLLEILFVLMLIGLVGSLVVPRVDGLYDSVVLSSEREDILNGVRSLPVLARNQGISVEVDSNLVSDLLSGQVADGWVVSAADGLRFKANGFCTGGVLTLGHESGRSWRYILEAPYCRPRVLNDE